MSEAGFADWLAIVDLKAVYCRLLDEKDWEAWGEVFTEDVENDLTAAGAGTSKGREALVTETRQEFQTVKTVHQVHFPEITIDGDQATAIWPMQDRLVWENGRSLTAYGHYHDTYRRTAQGWRIASMRLTRLIKDYTLPTE